METNIKAYSYIRFSSEKQKEGDSLRRQTEASEKYVKENGLILDTTLYMQDLGKSAFHGINISQGYLGGFLECIKKGQIEKGSVLLIENIDRLSRMKPTEAYRLFDQIIQAGIKIVTLQSGMEYTEESINENQGQLYVIVGEIQRSNRESKVKSERLKAVWENKRGKAIEGNYKMTGKAPAWIKVDNQKRFVLIPDVCKAIELIYRMKLAGMGAEKISFELNRNHEVWKPTIGGRNKTGGWRKSYVNKLLWENRQLIGEFQPYKSDSGKREKAGEPIPNYYPLALDKELFFSVQSLIKINSEKGKSRGGKTGKATNLFSHVAICGLCGSPMHFIDKGNSPKGGQYLHCDHSHRKLGDCEAKPIRYDEFQKLFFKDFDELDISEILPDSKEKNLQISALQKAIGLKRFELSEMDKKISNLTLQLSETDSSEIGQIIKNQIQAFISQKESISEDIHGNEKILLEIQSKDTILFEGQVEVKKLFELLDRPGDEEEKIKLRLALRAQIRRICKSIQIYPLMEKYQEFEEIELGIIKVSSSRYIRKIRIRFNGSKNWRVLYVQSYGEIIN